jgi:NlpC/P60 family putative phage cell wall peptidase
MTDRAEATADAAAGAAIVVCARAWIGTPYRHQASCRGAGADCLGLLRGVWREVIGEEPEEPPAYTPDWSEPSRSEELMRAAGRHLRRVAPEGRVPGDVALLRMRDGAVAKHVGFLACSPAHHETLIHAYSGHGVVESPFTPAWRRRIAAVYRFPLRRD